MKERILVGILLALVVLIYGNTLVNGFVLDDDLYITHNAQVVDPTLHNLFSANPVTNVFRPVTFATMALNWKFSHGAPASFHLLNLLLHAGTTWLLFILLQELLGTTVEGTSIAFAAALLYAVLPIHTEAVAWAVGRAEILAAGFVFAAWILHLRGRTVPALICFALALLSKESAIVFLPLVVLGDYAIGKWQSRLQYALEAGLSALFVGILWKVQGGQFGQNGISPIDNPLVTLPAGWRILNAVRVAWKYVELQIYPASLSCDYSFNVIPVYRDWQHTLPAALAAAAVVGLWVWALRTRRAGWAIAGSIYLVGFAVTANILIRTGAIVAERFAYLPSAGFCLLVALAWNFLRQKQERAAWALLGVVTLAFAVRVMVRNRDWKDPLSLYASAVSAAPSDAKMHANLGGQYFIRNQWDLAATQFQMSLRIAPESADTLATYAALEFERGNLQNASEMAAKALSMSDRNDLNYDFMMVNYAAILTKMRQDDKAFQYLDRETHESPMYAPGWSTRAELHCIRGELAAGRADAEMSLRMNPADPQGMHVMQWLDSGKPTSTTPTAQH